MNFYVGVLTKGVEKHVFVKKVWESHASFKGVNEFQPLLAIFLLISVKSYSEYLHTHIAMFRENLCGKRHTLKWQIKIFLAFYEFLFRYGQNYI